MIELDEHILGRMIELMGPRIRRLGYREARENAVTTYRFTDTTEEETEAYRRRLDQHFHQRAMSAIRLKHRPRAPLEAYEGDQ